LGWMAGSEAGHDEVLKRDDLERSPYQCPHAEVAAKRPAKHPSG
jgi:hypothetical protein